MKRVLMIFFAFSFCAMLMGCSSRVSNSDKSDAVPGKLLVEEQISPNEQYVSSDADVVYYTVKIYQDKDNLITVDTESNSSFFKPIQYCIECNDTITKENTDIQWTTLMGDSDPTEDNQLAIADISISIDSEVISERKVEFANGGMEIVIDTINNNM